MPLKIVNHLPHFLACLKRWDESPSSGQLQKEYVLPIQAHLEPMLQDWRGRGQSGFYRAMRELDWTVFRSQTLRLDPELEAQRLSKHISSVEEITGVELNGDAILFGSFGLMDGYARFDQGRHQVYLGVDESFLHESYLDILETHELTHVARESRATVWEGWGISPTCTHDEFTDQQPVLEHLFGEGFSCAVSELLVPGHSPWLYCYQTEASWQLIQDRAQAIDERIWEHLDQPSGDYGELYDPETYREEVPRYAHYAWAWQWAKSMIRKNGPGSPARLVGACSKDWLVEARRFSLQEQLNQRG
jgi:hypothetical protein